MKSVKNMKMLSTAMIAAVLTVSAFALPVHAEENTTSASTEFSYVQKNEPTYTVSIPSALALSKEGTALNIEAKDVADLDGKKVTVTIAGTDYYRNQLVLQAKTSKPTYTGTIRYQLIAADGNTIETTGNDTATGTELASFTGNGTVTYTAKPVLDPRMNIEPGVNYTGTRTFGIGLTE